MFIWKISLKRGAQSKTNSFEWIFMVIPLKFSSYTIFNLEWRFRWVLVLFPHILTKNSNFVLLCACRKSTLTVEIARIWNVCPSPTQVSLYVTCLLRKVRRLFHRTQSLWKELNSKSKRRLCQTVLSAPKLFHSPCNESCLEKHGPRTCD